MKRVMRIANQRKLNILQTSTITPMVFGFGEFPPQQRGRHEISKTLNLI